MIYFWSVINKWAYILIRTLVCPSVDIFEVKPLSYLLLTSIRSSWSTPRTKHASEHWVVFHVCILQYMLYLIVRYMPSKHCSTGTIPAQYRGYCRNGTGPPLFYCHLRNSDLPFCTSAFYRSGTGKLLPYRYQPAQLHYIASIIYVVAWCWASTTPVQNLLCSCHWPRTIQPVSG